MIDRRGMWVRMPAVMLPQEEIAEERIREALAAGEFDDLEGRGRALDLDPYFATPANWRMGLSVLRSAEVVPEEVHLLRELNELKARRRDAPAEERKTLDARIARLETQYELGMERFRRT